MKAKPHIAILTTSVLLLSVTLASAQLNVTSVGAKCGLAARLNAMNLIEPVAGQTIPEVALAPAVYHASRVIGRFRFFYDTTGANAPAMLDGTGARIPGSHETFVDSAGAIFNDVYVAMTGVLGYGDPIQPAQTSYDVNIFNSVYYGETVPESQIGFSTPSRWITHINVDNDFQNYYSSGLQGLRVTAAHEFQHAVQFGVYGFWNSDFYFMELASTWMEDVLYDGVNDYYQYIRGAPGSTGYSPRGQFARPDYSFLRTDGLIEYSRAVFGKFIEKKYSRDIMRRTWELVPTSIAITALNRALVEQGSTFREAFSSWADWNAHTGPDADTTLYYSEGLEYPPIRTRPRIDFVSPRRSIIDSINTTSAAYFPVGVGDTVMSVIVVNTGSTGLPTMASFEYEMGDAGDASYRSLGNGLFVRLIVPDPANWESIESVPIEVQPVIFAGVTPGPNPLKSGMLNFFIPQYSIPGDVRLKILTPAMEEVYDGSLALRADLSFPGVQVAEWNGTDRHGRPVGSGVFIYLLSVDGTDHTGKIAVVR